MDTFPSSFKTKNPLLDSILFNPMNCSYVLLSKYFDEIKEKFLSAMIGQKDLFWPSKSQNTSNTHFYCMSIVSIRLPLVSTRLPLVPTRLYAFTTRLLSSTLLYLRFSTYQKNNHCPIHFIKK